MSHQFLNEPNSLSKALAVLLISFFSSWVLFRFSALYDFSFLFTGLYGAFHHSFDFFELFEKRLTSWMLVPEPFAIG